MIGFFILQCHCGQISVHVEVILQRFSEVAAKCLPCCRRHEPAPDLILDGGLGEHFDVDPVIFRIAFLLSIFIGGLGLLAYIILWIVLGEA